MANKKKILKMLKTYITYSKLSEKKLKNVQKFFLKKI